MDNATSQKIAKLYESGLSIKQVSETLGVSFSKVLSSLKQQSVPRRDHSSASRMLHSTKFGKKSCKVKPQLSPEEELLRVAGIMLYWGEGTKSGNSVVFSNSDPGMVRLFLEFLRKICRAEESRLRPLLHTYSDQNEAELLQFWSKAMNIPPEQFSKSFVHQGKSGTYKKLSQYGTISLRYSDTELLKTINKWLSKYKMPI